MFNTEAPFVTTQRGGRRMSHHYTEAAANAEAKASGKYRVVHGMHRGSWKELSHFDKGIKLCLGNLK